VDTFSWTTTSRVSVSGLAGWAPIERVEVTQQGGRAVVRVDRYPVTPGADLETLATIHGDSVAVDGWSDSGLAPTAVLGTDGLVRRVSWSGEDGSRQRADLQYALAHGRLVVVTTVTPEDDAVLAGEAAAIAASVRLREPLLVPDTALPLRPGEVDLAELAQAWQSGTRPQEAAEHVVTTEETFGAARHFGVAMLPGADTGQWDQLDASERELAAAVAWRSLEARGADDSTDLAEALQLAASHDLIVLVTARRDAESASQWFAARPDRMVRLRPVGNGRMVLSTHPTTDLADLVLGAHRPGTTSTASAVYRSDGHVIGDETSWTGDDPAADVRAALAGLVTGSRARSAP
jgi:hypothetical protein